MQLKYLLLAFTGQSALAALQTFTFDDGTTIEADPESVVSPHSPNNAKSSRTVDSSPAGAKMLLARSCPQPEYPNTCQGGDLCCQTDDFCCEGQSCVDPDIHNCCLYGYYCEKPYRCVKHDNGNIGCMQ